MTGARKTLLFVRIFLAFCKDGEKKWKKAKKKRKKIEKKCNKCDKKKSASDYLSKKAIAAKYVTRKKKRKKKKKRRGVKIDENSVFIPSEDDTCIFSCRWQLTAQSNGQLSSRCSHSESVTLFQSFIKRLFIGATKKKKKKKLCYHCFLSHLCTSEFFE